MQVIQESVIEKAKKFVVNNKGKLAALAGLAAVGGAGYVAYKNGMLDNILNHEQEPGNNTGKTSGAGAEAGKTSKSENSSINFPSNKNNITVTTADGKTSVVPDNKVNEVLKKIPTVNYGNESNTEVNQTTNANNSYESPVDKYISTLASDAAKSIADRAKYHNIWR